MPTTKPTIGAHIYEAEVVDELRRRGLQCSAVMRITIPPSQCYHAILADATKFQKRCGAYVRSGLYPTFTPAEHAIIVYVVAPKTGRRGA